MGVEGRVFDVTLHIFAGVVELRIPNTVCAVLFIEPRESRNRGWYGNYTGGPRLKNTSERVWFCVCLCTYRESRQRDLAVHPHVALHLSLLLFLGAQFIWRDAISGGCTDRSQKVNYPIKHIRKKLGS